MQRTDTTARLRRSQDCHWSTARRHGLSGWRSATLLIAETLLCSCHAPRPAPVNNDVISPTWTAVRCNFSSQTQSFSPRGARLFVQQLRHPPGPGCLTLPCPDWSASWHEWTAAVAGPQQPCRGEFTARQFLWTEYLYFTDKKGSKLIKIWMILVTLL